MPDLSRRYTPGEWKAIVNSLVTLITEKLPEIEARLRRLRVDGELDDDSDNALDDAIDDHLDIHSGIETLARTLRRCETISADSAAQADYVRSGSKVIVRTEEGELEAYQISSPYAHIPGRGQLHAAVQGATFGKRAGDTVRVKTPIRTYDLEIVSIEQHPLVLREAESSMQLDAGAE